MIGVIRSGIERYVNQAIRLASTYSDAHDTLDKHRQVNLRTDYIITVVWSTYKNYAFFVLDKSKSPIKGDFGMVFAAAYL